MLKQFVERFSTAFNCKSGRRQQNVPIFETLENRVLLAVQPLGPMQGGTPNYFGPEPNWAYSVQPTVDVGTGAVTGGIPKFVDSLPGLYFANADPVIDAANLAAADNNLGQYIPVAVPDTQTYTGSDYYEIALVQYTEKLSSSLNPTTLRGYVQIETPVNVNVSHHVALTHPDGTPILDSAGAPVYALNSPEYLGPMIVAAKDRPVRIKFTNYLSTGAGGDLFLPVDTTEMGAGMGPNMIMPMHTHYTAGNPTVSIHAMEPHNLSVGSLVELKGFTPDAYNGEFRVTVVTSNLGFRVTLNTDPGSEATVLGTAAEMYTENRATLHLHGGRTPWISDGTPHQWITPAGENTNYPEGVSVQNVPDMPDPGPGSMTFFYSNQQSARLMFYHDHSYGITRLNVYAGEAAGYLLTDPVEQDLIARGILPAAEVPLIIQDKTFIDPTTVLTTDPTWPFQVDDALSNLWYPHVYMTNQNPNSPDGANPIGRWDYGPWFWPPWPTANPPIEVPDGSLGFGTDGMPDVLPNLPDLSMTMEAYQDTPLVNGTLYPYFDVQPQAYRFRILNAANDRMWNLQLYEASTIVSGLALTGGGSGYTRVPPVTITPATGDTTGMGATATATIDPATGAVTGITLVTVGSGYTAAPTVTIAPPTTAGGTAATATAAIYTGTSEVGMVPAIPGAAEFPVDWTVQTLGQPGDILDGRFGGVPDPRTIGPSMVQISTEGGFLPSPVIWTNTPIGFERNPKNIVVTNVSQHNLFLGPAERADVIIDFSQFAGETIILYNDGPAATPAADSRVDYFTADVDQTDTGGSIPTLPGYGPNTRTIMAFHVSATGTPTPFDLAALYAEFTTTATHDGVFVRDQDPILVPQAAYNDAYGANFPVGANAYERIQSTSLTFNPLDLSTPALADQVATPVTIVNQPKAIQELFENTYGRMVANLGVELPFTNGQNQTTIPYGYIDPVTEIINDTADPRLTPIGSLGDGTQIWKITHNGVDTHPIHFHLFDVQLINRVGWDGQVVPPDPNELGWKETLRMNPLQDCIVALRPVAPKDPFGLPDSIRLLNPTMPQGSTTGFFGVDPQGNPVSVTNEPTNFGWEYMWHCHILSHEEMDMMRPVQFNVARTLPAAPVLNRVVNGTQVNLSWTDGTPVSDPATLGNPANEIGYRIDRAYIDSSGNLGAYLPIGSALANATAYVDTTFNPILAYSYQVVAYNAAGDSASNAVLAGTLMIPEAPTSLAAALQFGPQASLTWMDNAAIETGFVVQRSDNGGPFTTIATAPALAGTGTVTYVDKTTQPGNIYVYQVYAVNGIYASPLSNAASVTVPAAPVAPTNLVATLQAAYGTAPRIVLTFRDNATNETGFLLERSVNGGFFASLVTLPARKSRGNVTYTDTVAAGNTYAYRVRAVNGVVLSAYSNTVTRVVPPAPAAPLNFTAIATATSRTAARINLSWTDNSNNETRFVIRRATAIDANGNLVNPTIFTVTRSAAQSKAVGGTVTLTQTGLRRATTYYYRILARNLYGNSVWVNLNFFPITTP